MLRAAAKKRQGQHVLALFLCLLAVGCTAEQPGRETSPDCTLAGSEAREFRVERVVDGDTLRLAGGERVRLIGINTPELGHGSGADEPLAPEARDALRELAGSRVRLLDGPDARDDHGRRLAWAFDSAGNSVEAELLRRGLGFHVAIAPNSGGAECLAAAEADAREHARGVWDEPFYRPRTAAALAPGYRGFALLEDRVTRVSFKENGWWLQLGGKIGVKISPESQHLYSRKALAGLEGRSASVRGWLVPMSGGWWVLTLGHPGMLQPDARSAMVE